MSERSAYITLNLIEGVGPVRTRSLISELGSVEAILAADESRLLAVGGVGRDLAAKITSQREQIDADAEIGKAAEMGARIITPLDKEYPKHLKEIHDPPLALYVLGDIQAKDKHAVAVVGTRRATRYGIDCAERLSYELAQAGFVVISGLARGIDTAAHKGALKAGGRTVAVIGSGLNCIYPAENRQLAKEISEQGAVISEFALDRKPDKSSFPIRNRVVSGMSMGTIVIEAGVKSGAMITATQAMEQGRSVFAVPGRIDSHGSRGPHRLIRDGARLIESIDDVIDELQFLLPTSVGRGGRRDSGKTGDTGQSLASLTADESRLVDLLDAGELDVDSIIRNTGLEPAKVSSMLIGLEMKRVIRMLPGRIVELLHEYQKPEASV